MEKLIGDVSYYYNNVSAAIGRAPLPSALIGAVWFCVPFTIQMILHPSDVIRFQHWLAGETIPFYFTPPMLSAGELTAVFGLAIEGLLLLVGLVLLYRRTRFAVALWPVAGILLGMIGNAFWWRLLLEFDPIGALAGFAPLALSVGGEWVCEQLGQDFVFGPGVRPRFQG